MFFHGHGHWPSFVGTFKVVNASIFSQRDAAARATLTDTVLYRYGSQPLRRSLFAFLSNAMVVGQRRKVRRKETNEQEREEGTKHKKKEWREEKRNEKGSEN